jgi:2-polyprenyl-6-hydroxyphenyl methylase/3-demethylubiquinone-9 3-methyltransferase
MTDARTHEPAEPPGAGSVDPDEVARFEAMAEAWWDPQGSFRPLHKLNPVRLGFLRDRLVRHFGRDPHAVRPLEGLRVVDIGCGGGLVCEPLARLGAEVTGIDASARNVSIAAAHAEESGLAIDYRAVAAETLAAEGHRYDVVLALEIVEHVADPDLFIDACCRLARPGGLLVFATLNRTPKSFALAIVGAEYLLRWLPRGTHDWRKFLRPSELARLLARHGASLEALTGVVYNPISDRWRLADDLDVNYMAVARPAASPASA